MVGAFLDDFSVHPALRYRACKPEYILQLFAYDVYSAASAHF